jgi:hypothetical protein
MAFLRDGHSTYHRAQLRALRQTQKYMEALNGREAIRREESPDLYRDALACYHRLSQLLSDADNFQAPERRRIDPPAAIPT